MLVRKDKWNSSINCCQGKCAEGEQMKREESAWWLEATQVHSCGFVHFFRETLEPSYISPPSNICMPSLNPSGPKSCSWGSCQRLKYAPHSGTFVKCMSSEAQAWGQSEGDWCQEVYERILETDSCWDPGDKFMVGFDLCHWLSVHFSCANKELILYRVRGHLF